MLFIVLLTVNVNDNTEDINTKDNIIYGEYRANSEVVYYLKLRKIYVLKIRVDNI